MIEIMDQLSPVILESFVSVAISDTVSHSLFLQRSLLCGIVCYASTVPSIIAIIKPNVPQ